MIAWMLYATLLSVLLGLAALALERAATLFRLPVRWIWCLGLAAGVILPLLPRGPAALSRTGSGTALLDPAGLWRLPGTAIERAGASAPSADLVLTVLWIAASAGFLLWLAWCAAKLHRESAEWTWQVVDGTSVLVSENLGPAVLGPMGSAIVIPRWLLAAPAESRRLALEHERSHLAARDATLVWAATLAVIAMPWNPVLWWQLARLRAAIELDCDRRVLAGGAPVRRYAELLLQLAGSPGRWLLRPTLNQPEAVLGRRILALMGGTVRLRFLQAVGLAAAGLTLVVLACQTEPPQAPSAAAHSSPAAAPPTVVEGPARAPFTAVNRAGSPDSVVFQAERLALGSEPQENARQTIRVRCAQSCEVTSVPPDREPLFIVDEIIQTQRPNLEALEGKIESIEVVKGAAARSLYGDKGKNGVIRITLKKLETRR